MSTLASTESVFLNTTPCVYNGIDVNSLNMSVLDFSLTNRNDTHMKEEVNLLTIDGITGILPTRGSTHAACKDLYSPISTVVPAGGRVLIKTNVAVAWNDPDYYMQLLPRSSLAYKNWTDVKAGVIDFDYRQNIGVILHNYSDKDLVINSGDRIAQYTYVKIRREETTVVDEFTIPLESNRTGGFGSTGK